MVRRQGGVVRAVTEGPPDEDLAVEGGGSKGVAVGRVGESVDGPCVTLQ